MPQAFAQTVKDVRTYDEIQKSEHLDFQL